MFTNAQPRPPTRSLFLAKFSSAFSRSEEASYQVRSIYPSIYLVRSLVRSSLPNRKRNKSWQNHSITVSWPKQTQQKLLLIKSTSMRQPVSQWCRRGLAWPGLTSSPFDDNGNKDDAACNPQLVFVLEISPRRSRRRKKYISIISMINIGPSWQGKARQEWMNNQWWWWGNIT